PAAVREDSHKHPRQPQGPTGLPGREGSPAPASPLHSQLASGIHGANHKRYSRERKTVAHSSNTSTPRHSTYMNSFRHNSTWQKSARARSRASAFPAARYDADCAVTNANPSASSSAVGGRATAVTYPARIAPGRSVAASGATRLAKAFAYSRLLALFISNSACGATVVDDRSPMLDRASGASKTCIIGTSLLRLTVK